MYNDCRIQIKVLTDLANEIEANFGKPADIFYSPSRTVYGGKAKQKQGQKMSEKVTIPASGRFMSRINYISTNINFFK